MLVKASTFLTEFPCDIYQSDITFSSELTLHSTLLLLQSPHSFASTPFPPISASTFSSLRSTRECR
eukprot:766201-Hanusia_phi.AAC.4